MTIAVGPWLRGSDSAALESAWCQVSGLSGMPLTAGTYYWYGFDWEYHVEEADMDPDEYGHKLDLDPDTSAFIFATVTIENLSTGRDPDRYLRGGTETNAAGDQIEVTSGSRLAITGGGYYPSEAEDKDWSGVGVAFWCYDELCGHNTPSDLPNIEIMPTFGGRQKVGPKPIVMALPAVFGADSPDGDPELVEYYLRVRTRGEKLGGKIDLHEDPRFPDVSIKIPTEFSWSQPES